jgi:HEAT repeat protein
MNGVGTCKGGADGPPMTLTGSGGTTLGRQTVRFSPRYLGVTCSIFVLLAARGWAVDRVEEFNKAKRAVVQQLHSKEPSTRAAGLTRLQEFPIADAVKLIHAGLSDPDEEVQEAALASLLKMNGNQEVCDTLLTIAKKIASRRDDPAGIAPLLAVLLSSNLPTVQRATNEFFDKLASSKNGVDVVISMADELGRHHKPADVGPLVQLTKTKIFERHFGVRRSVVHALTLIPSPDAVGALIEIMLKVRGEAQADAVEYLAQITGQIFGMESKAWQRWWDEVADTFEYPVRTGRAPYRSVATTSSEYYYGLPVFAERLVFVLYTSGSMTGARIVAAKRELVRAISGLPEHAHFGIVVFNSSVAVWHKELVPATVQWKNAAMTFVNSQETRANTASYDALETAFGFDTEAIYFLSDGAPHGGKIPAPVDIVTAITAANRTRRISLYTIGIGAGIPGGPLDTFLKTLAEQNLGLYRRVDG